LPAILILLHSFQASKEKFFCTNLGDQLVFLLSSVCYSLFFGFLLLCKHSSVILLAGSVKKTRKKIGVCLRAATAHLGNRNFVFKEREGHFPSVLLQYKK